MEKEEVRDYILIKDIPEDERPREKMLKQGSEYLSNAELLAILLRTGTQKQSAFTLAQKIIKEIKSLSNLHQMEIEQLMQIKGIGLAKAVQIKAALELGKRVAQASGDDKYTIKSPQDAANYMMEEMRYLAQEHFYALLLNVKNQVLSKELISVGSINSSIVHPREVFKQAIIKNASSLIVLHNHPSGDPTPSREDLEVTKRLSETGKIIGIEILDHIVIGNLRFVSLKEKGLI